MYALRNRFFPAFDMLRKHGYTCRVRQTDTVYNKWYFHSDPIISPYFSRTILAKPKYVFSTTSNHWQLSTYSPLASINLAWKGDLDEICAILTSCGLNVQKPAGRFKSIKVSRIPEAIDEH
jgi:hypothetical protein